VLIKRGMRMCEACQEDWYEVIEDHLGDSDYNEEEKGLYRYFAFDERWQHFHDIQIKKLSLEDFYDGTRSVYEVTLIYWVGGFDKIKIRAITTSKDPDDPKVFDDIDDDDLVMEAVRSFTDETCTQVTEEFKKLW
jgi:hypothetical protein